MDRQFDVLPLMSAGDYVTHGDTLYITFNPGSAAKEEDSESSPAAVLNTRMTGGVMARFTYQAVDEGFQCTLEFGDQILASVAPSKKMAKQLVATKYLEANPSPDKTPLLRVTTMKLVLEEMENTFYPTRGGVESTPSW